jgi:Ion channel
MRHWSPLLEILLGTVPLLGTLFIHGAGMNLVQWRLRQRGAPRRRSRLLPDVDFALMILVILVTHLAEIALWTGTLIFLGAIPSLRDAFYYVAGTYTTLGYGEGTLPEVWRLMGPMIAISGLFAFGWTTSVLMNVVAQVNAERNAEERSSEGG